TTIDPKTMRAAHVVEQTGEWGLRGFRMLSARPSIMSPETLEAVSESEDHHCPACGYHSCSRNVGVPCTPVEAVPVEAPAPRFEVGQRVRVKDDARVLFGFGLRIAAPGSDVNGCAGRVIQIQEIDHHGN